MALNKYRLGDLIEPVDERNENNAFAENDVRGISTSKQFINTKADLNGVSLANYKVVRKGCFAYVSDTSRRGDKIALAYCDRNCIISSIYTVFMISRTDIINAYYLYMFFNRPEFDRYSRFNSWGSARETFSWEDMCDIEIELPDLPTQEKYAKIYLSMLENQKNYEEKLERVKATIAANIEVIRKCKTYSSILPFLEERREVNKDGKISFMKGIGLKGFINPNQVRTFESLKRCKLFYKGDFIYAPSSFKNGVICYNNYFDKAICSEEYIVFSIKDVKQLNPYYLLMWLKRDELGRFIDFMSMDSVRNRFYFHDLDIVEIPVLKPEKQIAIGEIYKCFIKLNELYNELIEKIKNICPILIKGSIEEGRREV